MTKMCYNNNHEKRSHRKPRDALFHPKRAFCWHNFLRRSKGESRSDYRANQRRIASNCKEIRDEAPAGLFRGNNAVKRVRVKILSVKKYTPRKEHLYE